MGWLAAAVPSIISGVSSFIGGRARNRASAAEARRNRKFQERMSSTAHQREVLDLRKAGLNPILSATGGSGASTPGGSMAQFQDVMTPAVNSAIAGRRLSQEMRNMKATERVAVTQAALNQSAADLNSARAAFTNTQDSALSGPAAVGGWLGALGETWSAKGPGIVSDAKKWIMDNLSQLLRTGSSASGIRRMEQRPSYQERRQESRLRINIRRGRQPE